MNVNDHLPLREVSFFILFSLARTPKHGYAILQDVAAVSAGRFQLGTGTLYGALRRMLDQGWIERFDEASAVVDGRVRKAYRITDLGRKILNADTARIEDFFALVQGKLA